MFRWPVPLVGVVSLPTAMTRVGCCCCPRGVVGTVLRTALTFGSGSRAKSPTVGLDRLASITVAVGLRGHSIQHTQQTPKKSPVVFDDCATKLNCGDDRRKLTFSRSASLQVARRGGREGDRGWLHSLRSIQLKSLTILRAYARVSRGSRFCCTHLCFDKDGVEPHRGAAGKANRGQQGRTDEHRQRVASTPGMKDAPSQQGV